MVMAGSFFYAAIVGLLFQDCGAVDSWNCDQAFNFVTGAPYSQLSLTSSCPCCSCNPAYGSPNSVSSAVEWCKAKCDQQSTCTGFFFQKHTNGHEICGFYTGLNPLDSTGKAWHGHSSGSQLCAKGQPNSGGHGQGWPVVYGPKNGAAVKSLVQSGMYLIGPRAAAEVVNGQRLSTLETWVSIDQGRSWTKIGLIARAPNQNLIYGDPVVLAVPDSDIVLAAFRERWTGLPNGKDSFSIVLCRSDNNGQTWAFDSMITGPFQGTPGVPDHFVGAPFLRYDSGMLEVYYDNEPLPNQRGETRHHQWITMLKRDALSKNTAWPQTPTVVSKTSGNALSRDGMASVVDIGNNQLMVVTESVSLIPPHPNVVSATFSWDGGATWDMGSRKTIYEGKLDATTGNRFNAFCPWAIRVGGGPVWVAFLTDEDFPSPPDASNERVEVRRSSVKYIETTTNFQTFSSNALLISDQSATNYKPGMFERDVNTVLCTVDTLKDGKQVVMEKSR